MFYNPVMSGEEFFFLPAGEEFMRFSNTSCKAKEVLKDKNLIGFLEALYT